MPETPHAVLCHVTTEAEWADAQAAEVHASPALDRDGFLHCCTENQLGFVLAKHFSGATSLLVLRFDPARVGSAIEWAKSEPDQDPFPHLHGPLPVAAVLSATATG